MNCKLIGMPVHGDRREQVRLNRPDVGLYIGKSMCRGADKAVEGVCLRRTIDREFVPEWTGTPSSMSSSRGQPDRKIL